jgi:hypothetical protein
VGITTFFIYFTQAEVDWEKELRRIFRLMRDEVIGGWRKLHNEELHNLYSLPRLITRSMRYVRCIARMGEKRNMYRILSGKPQGKRPPRRPICRLMDNIKLYLRGTEWDGMAWAGLVKDREKWKPLVNTVMNP